MPRRTKRRQRLASSPPLFNQGFQRSLRGLGSRADFPESRHQIGIGPSATLHAGGEKGNSPSALGDPDAAAFRGKIDEGGEPVFGLEGAEGDSLG